MRRLLLTLLFAAASAAHAAGDELLEPDKAFRFSAQALDAGTAEVRYRIADGYYLYRERFRFAAEPASVTLGTPRFPEGEIHEDKFFGKQVTYRREVRILLPLAAAGADRIRLTVTSQGCADIGVCYVPQTQSAELRLAALGGGRSSIFRKDDLLSPVPERKAAPSEELRFTGVLESGRLWAVVVVFFVAGLLLTFTPCVLPMIPILSGIIVGEGRGVTRRRAGLISLAYVLGMAVTYTATSASRRHSPETCSSALQNAWVLGAFAAVFVRLALSMFRFYELQLPSGWQSRLTQASTASAAAAGGAVAW
jgi:thiol:disulfide interchange protein DsbD